MVTSSTDGAASLYAGYYASVQNANANGQTAYIPQIEAALSDQAIKTSTRSMAAQFPGRFLGYG
jgi:hypothetical protein